MTFALTEGNVVSEVELALDVPFNHDVAMELARAVYKEAVGSGLVGEAECCGVIESWGSSKITLTDEDLKCTQPTNKP